MCIITKAKRRLAGKPETAEEDASSPVVIVEEENEEMVSEENIIHQKSLDGNAVNST